MRRTLLLLGLAVASAVLGLVLITPRPALAHANFVFSVPAPGTVLSQPPTEVRITFSETPAPRFSFIMVFNTAREGVDSAPTRSDPTDPQTLLVPLMPLDKGIYTVSWEVLSSVDGHVTRGSYSFAVGPADLAAQLSASAPAASPSGVSSGEALASFALFMAAAVVIGTLAFQYLVWRRSMEALRPRRLPDLSPDGLVRWAALLLLLMGFAFLALRATESGVGSLPGTRAGVMALWRFGLAIALAVVALWSSNNWRARYPTLLAVGVAILATMSLASHNAALARPAALGVLLDLAHLLAMAVWAGGLFALFLWLRQMFKQTPDSERGALLGQVVPRFSLMAGSAVAVVIATGIYSALTLERTPQALVSSAHGWTLLVKLVLVGAVLTVAATNLLIMRPRLARATGDVARKGQRLFQALVGTEGVGVTLVLLVTGFLTTVSPPSRTATTGPSLQSSLVVEGAHISLGLSPARIGTNRMEITLRHAEEHPVPAQRVLVKLAYRDQDIGESIVPTSSDATGRFTAIGLLGLPGTWRIGVSAQVSEGPDVEGEFQLVIPDSGRARLMPAPTGAVIDAGRRLYGQYCARCHGVSGFGDGPDAVGLKPPPLNLNIHVPYHGDQQLFHFIAEGLAGTAMRAWKGTLTEDQIWALVHYLRATFKEELQ